MRKRCISLEITRPDLKYYKDLLSWTRGHNIKVTVYIADVTVLSKLGLKP